MDGTGRSTIMLKIDTDICHACRKCLAKQVCRFHAILSIDRDEPPFLDSSRCRGCLVCVTTCPFDAIVRHG
jgi:MinD superfamily P-loop ATPase